MVTSVARPRGTCPVCGKSIRVKQDGTMFYHGYSTAIRNSGDRYANPGFCRGMGKLPAKAEERAS